MPVANPEIAIILIAVGALSITLEFCLPGKVIPAVFGAVLVTVGLASLVSTAAPFPTTLATAVFLPIATLIALLLKIAIRARRNKLSV
jgi:membrane protein implicated in regulation of membrane protease activity